MRILYDYGIITVMEGINHYQERDFKYNSLKQRLKKKNKDRLFFILTFHIYSLSQNTDGVLSIERTSPYHIGALWLMLILSSTLLRRSWTIRMFGKGDLGFIYNIIDAFVGKKRLKH